MFGDRRKHFGWAIVYVCWGVRPFHGRFDLEEATKVRSSPSLVLFPLGCVLLMGYLSRDAYRDGQMGNAWMFIGSMSLGFRTYYPLIIIEGVDPDWDGIHTMYLSIY